MMQQRQNHRARPAARKKIIISKGRIWFSRKPTTGNAASAANPVAAIAHMDL